MISHTLLVVEVDFDMCTHKFSKKNKIFGQVGGQVYSANALKSQNLINFVIGTQF